MVLDAVALGFPKHDVGLFLARNPSFLSKYWKVTNLLTASWPAVEFPQYFQAMHGEMAGFFEIRLQNGKFNARFFARVVRSDSEFLLVIAAASKPRRTGFPPMVYGTVRRAYSEFLSHPNQSSLLIDLF